MQTKTMYIATGDVKERQRGYVDITRARSNTGRYYGKRNSPATTNIITDHEYGRPEHRGINDTRYDVKGWISGFTYNGYENRTE